MIGRFWQNFLVLKYFDKIEMARRANEHQPKDVIRPFDITILGQPGIFRRTVSRVVRVLAGIFLAVLREIKPTIRIGRLVIVTRYDDVVEVLGNSDAFVVPFGPEMTDLAGGTNFVLGAEDDAHERQWLQIRAVVREGDVELVRKQTRYMAERLLKGAGGRIDVMRDYITRTATASCAAYFGFAVDDHDQLADWSFAISNLLFADPFGKPEARELALAGADRLRGMIDRAIAAAKETRESEGQASEHTLIGRLVNLQAGDRPPPGICAEPPTDGEIRAIMVGLTTGFIPTNTLGGGRMFEELLRRPAAMRRASTAALSGDRETLENILLECGRLNPALWPGQWRYAQKECVIAADTGRAYRVPKGSVLLVATASALRDRRRYPNPGRFEDRCDRKQNLLFGDGLHECLGRYLAVAQISECMAELLSQCELKRYPGRAGRLVWLGPFPRRLDMLFRAIGSPREQSMITICMPVHQDRTKELRTKLAELGPLAQGQVHHDLCSSGIVHFASMSMIEAGDEAEPAAMLLFELNVDGDADAAIDKIANACGAWLLPIFDLAESGEGTLTDRLRRHVLDLRFRPWGATGLNFNGTPEFCVADIDMQARLADFSRRALQYFNKFHLGVRPSAMGALGFVRTLIHSDDGWRKAKLANPDLADEYKTLIRDGAAFRDDLIRPSRRRLQISEWQPRSTLDAWWRLLNAPELRRLLRWSAGILLTLMAFHIWLGAGDLPAATGVMGWISLGLISFLQSLLEFAVFVVIAVAVFVAILWTHEASDKPDDRNPPLDLVQRLEEADNHVGYVQNHLIANTLLKPGWFRRVTLALSLWGIAKLVSTWFRPGFVLNIGTIHYARWFRLPKHDRLIFLANYDGSWESYLEDFITKAHKGQTAAWSHGVGFPRTRLLINGGAHDGDRFKRWVRRQQVPTQFWFSRFPGLTTNQIRNNALIHDGLMRAHTDSAARAWLDSFGTMPRPDHAIETEEVQSLVFRGVRNLPHGVCALLELPKPRKLTHAWLSELINPMGRSNELGSIGFGDRGYLGDDGREVPVSFLAFTAAGLAKLGLPPDGASRSQHLPSFPTVFNTGMAARSRILGDVGDSRPSRWRWADIPVAGEPDGHQAKAADIALFIYDHDAESCAQRLRAHLKALGGANVLQEQVVMRAVDIENLDARTNEHPLDYEHFGFRDGISQPVIRGTRRFAKGAPESDVVEPGELILGYRNNQGYFPPGVVIRPELDRRHRLPIVAKGFPSRFPRFRRAETPDVRDFGRNGTFIAIRELAQDVPGFKEFTQKKADELNKYYNLNLVVGQKINADWVAAKLVGRWQDGSSLLHKPTAQSASAQEPDENFPATSASIDDTVAPEFANAPLLKQQPLRPGGFDFGRDDPQGLHCPFGSHVRRANPRDSLEPLDPAQSVITGRHRILRRGRTYYRPAEEGQEVEKGLLFVAMCSDLERQYEFVQQTWINSPNFHGLNHEPDPLVTPDQGQTRRTFSIPTPAGTIMLEDMQSFITVRGGGYFFLPSRSSLQFLADLIAIQRAPD